MYLIIHNIYVGIKYRLNPIYIFKENVISYCYLLKANSSSKHSTTWSLTSFCFPLAPTPLPPRLMVWGSFFGRGAGY